ncbi:DgyrCDS10500 [Dimorphilus gyrociliatus]|uniref:DgyrCDS10500 n=1 Tax=Dimorphilus gyrociliatus TaxID=2664684 RepID=A0A7I8W0D1_9ANNE|nr:DgyrCDS10500 [Dimorphilus gyrociliatus]
MSHPRQLRQGMDPVYSEVRRGNFIPQQGVQLNGQMSLHGNQHPPPPVPIKTTNGDNQYGSLPPSVSQAGVPLTHHFQTPIPIQPQAPKINQNYDPTLWSIKRQYEEQEQVMAFADDTFDDQESIKDVYIEERSQNGVHNYENAPAGGRAKNSSREYMNTFDDYGSKSWDRQLGY